MTRFVKVEDSLIHRLFYPQVPLVLSAQFGERVSAMPVVSYASISDKPPLIAVACSPRGYTCRLTLKAGTFSLSILDRTRSKAVVSLATLSGAKVKDKLKEAGLSHVNGRILGVPVIEGSIATLECKLRESRRLGDHLLLVGTVKAAYASEAFTEFWDFGRYRPVLYTGWRDGLTTYPEA
jgi:flavin reductase (DIM6/NTAB) family NADH-FMN oxidoreductase RutF